MEDIRIAKSIAGRVQPKRQGLAPAKACRKSDNSFREWKWLATKVNEIRPHEVLNKPRKGELPPNLVRSIWGKGSTTKVPFDSVKKWVQESTKFSYINKRWEKRKDKYGEKAHSTLMDVLLQNMTFFNHCHSSVSNVNKHIHSKYCEHEFGHFLLDSGAQVHVCYNVPVKFLVKELRQLLKQLRCQIIQKGYQEIPALKMPALEEVPEFEAPQMPSMPQLYPIEGLVPIPSEEDAGIPNDLPLPVFKSPIPKEYPKLSLPEHLKVPPLVFPSTPTCIDEEYTIDYDSYKAEALPELVLPEDEPLPCWEEPLLMELPKDPVYIEPEILPPPVIEKVPPYHPPVLDSKPCERAYYEPDSGEVGQCEGLCHGDYNKQPLPPDMRPCKAQPPLLSCVPPPPYPLPLQLRPEPLFHPPSEMLLPPFEDPPLLEEPVYSMGPSPDLPLWNDPQPPPFIGWLAGQRPLFLIDCSGTMAGPRLKYLWKCFETILSPGGQVEVAATHFDIITYSFDAWSFGTMENNRKYGSAMCAMRRMEPMQLKTASSLEAAIRWSTQWKPYGSTNLLGALNVALSRTFADCIYLFTDGKPDKPVLVVEALKKAQKEHGYSIPIHTVGLSPTVPGARFLKRISDSTGGNFMNVDVNVLNPPSLQGKLLEDTIWARSLIEADQRKNAELGVKEDLNEMIGRVKVKFDEARHKPRLAAYEEKVKLAKQEHSALLEEVRKENNRRRIEARQAYNQRFSVTIGKNKKNYEAALNNWKEEVNRIKVKNKQMLDEVEQWKKSSAEVQQYIARSRKEAKQRYKQDVLEIETKNILKIKKSKEEYERQVQRLREINETNVAEYEKKQKQLEHKVEGINKAIKEEYERAVSGIKSSNEDLLRRARADYEEKIASIKARNDQRRRDAQEEYIRKAKEIKLENQKKEEALAKRLEDVKNRRDLAITARQTEVARAVQEHEAKIKQYAELSADHEEKARQQWKKACDDIDAQNLAAVRRAMEEHEAQLKAVRLENAKLEEQQNKFQRQVKDIEKRNEDLIKIKKAEWKKACSELEQMYAKEISTAKKKHMKLVDEITARNEAAMQSALLEHKAKIAAVEKYNEAMKPMMESSNAVRAEVSRIEIFLNCIADACLPGEIRIASNTKKRRLENVLDLLTVSEKMINTTMLIKALEAAYNLGNLDDQKEYKCCSSSTPNKDLCRLTPIHPARPASHNCFPAEDARDPWLALSSFP